MAGDASHQAAVGAAQRPPALIAAGFGVAILMLAGVGAAAYRSIDLFEGRVRSMERTQEMFLANQDVLTLLKDGVIAQRGYVITGEPRYLEPYDAAVRTREERLETLRRLIQASDDQQRARLAEIEVLVTDVLRTIDASVALRAQGVDARAPEQVALIDAGKRLLDRARVVIKDIRSAANADLMEHLHDTEQTGKNTRLLLIVTDTVAIALLLMAFGLLRRELGRRERAEFALKRANDELESRILERTLQFEQANRDLSLKVAEYRQARHEVADLNSALERRVEERTAELGQANQGLERFAYSVSHDLRTPLRAVIGFTRTLEKEYGAGLDDEGRRLIGVILHSGRRMDWLIEDLLTYARLRRMPVQAIELDMKALATEAAHDVVAASGRSVHLVVNDLPAALADRSLIWEVWSNLLSNAVKFSSQQPQQRVEVGGSAEGDWCTYWVRDNGVGFNMKYYARLFGVFERLHDAEQFPGSGVGLAIVRSAIDKHQGKVWGEGKVGEGATFYFTLLRAQRP